MKVRTKKLVAIALLLPGLCIYLFAAAALGEMAPRFWLVQVLYYFVAGIAWAAPAILLLKWIESPPRK